MTGPPRHRKIPSRQMCGPHITADLPESSEIEVEGRTPHHQGQPSTNTISSHHSADTGQRSVVGRQWYLRRAASPWHYPPPGERGYEDAALHLLGCGLTPAPNRPGLQAMWRRGGRSRRAAEFIAEAWELAS